MKLSWQKISIISAFSIALLSSLQSANACTKNDHARPADVASDAVTKLFEEKNYKKLDELYSKYLHEKTATADGISALSVFFKGISQTFTACVTPKKTDEEWIAQKNSILAWSQSSPKSTAAKLALALFTIDYGWYARGSGYASTVDEKSRTLLDNRMSSAKHQLDALAEVGRNNPAWHAGMLYIGLAQGWEPEKFDALYEKAIKLDPYYLSIHYEISQYHSKYWYGSDEEMRDAIDRTTDLTKQRLGQTMYTRLHWKLSKSKAMFKTGGVSWERMKTGFNDYLKIFPDNYTRNHFAAFACIADDAISVKQQLDLLGEHVDPKQWSSKHEYAYCTALAKMSETGKKPRCFKFTGTEDYLCD